MGKKSPQVQKFRSAWVAYARAFEALPAPERDAVIAGIAKATGVSMQTVGRWSRNGSFPNGLEFLRLWYLMHVLGYETGFNALPSAMKYFCALFWRGFVSIDEAVKATGYPRRDEFLRPFTQGRLMSDERQQRLADYLTHHPHGVPFDELLLADVETFAKFRLDIGTPIAHPRTKAVQRRLPNQEPEPIGDLLRGIRGAMSIVAPLLEDTLHAGRESRDAFRETFETGELFELSNRLHRFTDLVSSLCSEKAREVVSNGEHREKEARHG